LRESKGRKSRLRKPKRKTRLRESKGSKSRLRESKGRKSRLRESKGRKPGLRESKGRKSRLRHPWKCLERRLRKARLLKSWEHRKSGMGRLCRRLWRRLWRRRSNGSRSRWRNKRYYRRS